MELQLAHDIRSVSFCCLYAESQRDCDFLRTLAFGQQLHDFAFAWGEPVPAQCSCRCLRAALEISVEDHGGNFGSEICFIATQCFNRDDQISCRVRFEQEAASAGIQYVAHYLIGIMKSQYQNL